MLCRYLVSQCFEEGGGGGLDLHPGWSRYPAREAVMMRQGVVWGVGDREKWWMASLTVYITPMRFMERMERLGSMGSPSGPESGVVCLA